MPRAARQARRPLQLSRRAYSSVRGAKKQLGDTPHHQPSPAFDSKHNYLAWLQPIFPSGAKGENMLGLFFFFFPAQKEQAVSEFPAAFLLDSRAKTRGRAGTTVSKSTRNIK